MIFFIGIGSVNNPKSSKVGWGHSTWQEAVKMAKAANVKRLVIFHHDPLHNDDFLDGVLEAAQKEFSGTIMAREGNSIDVFTLTESTII